MAKRQKSDNYDVGYGKPPKRTRFTPGQSGNPEGRPKRSRNVMTLVREELAHRVVLTEQGREFHLSKAEAIAKRLVNQALTGDMRAMTTLLKVMGEEEKFSDKVFEVLPDDEAAFEELRQRIIETEIDKRKK